VCLLRGTDWIFTYTCGLSCQKLRSVWSKPKPTTTTRSVRKVPSHFEYLENRSRDLDVTWQPARDLTTHPWTLSCGASHSAVRRRWLGLRTMWPSRPQWPSEQISESASMRLPILQLSLRYIFWQNIASPRSVSTSTAQIWLPATSGFSQR